MRIRLILLTLMLITGLGCVAQLSLNRHCHPAVKFQPMSDSSLMHMMRVNSRIYSGGEPHEERNFAELQRLGIKTIVSVDGARPQVDAAKAHGMRYVHVPIGYDGVPVEAAASLREVLDAYPGKVYIHCHHGKHRGPSAAAVAWCIDEERPGTEALELLRIVHTSENYTGLWRDVGKFELRDTAGISPELHEVAPVESLAAAMARIDRTWDNLKLCQAAGWQTPSAHPDVAPANEALILHETFVEIQRLDEQKRPDDFRQWLEESVEQSRAFRQALGENQAAAAEEHFNQLKQSCTDCHKAYRN